MAKLFRNGQVQLNDGRILDNGTFLTGADFLELVPLLRQLDPALGGGGGFSFGGGGRGAPGPRGPQGIQGPPAPTPSNNVESAHSLFSEVTLSDETPVTPPMTYDGATVASIPVPSGKLIITDAFFGFGFVFWLIEVDLGLGGGFKPLANFGFTLLSPTTTEVKRFRSPLVIKGGTGVAMRLKMIAAVAPPTPIDVNATIRLYSAP